MIKKFCDKCGKEALPKEAFYNIDISIAGTFEDSKASTIEVAVVDYCSRCYVKFLEVNKFKLRLL